MKKQTIKQTSLQKKKKRRKKKKFKSGKANKTTDQQAHWETVLQKFLSCLSNLSSHFANNGCGRSSTNLHYSFNFSIHLGTLEVFSQHYFPLTWQLGSYSHHAGRRKHFHFHLAAICHSTVIYPLEFRKPERCWNMIFNIFIRLIPAIIAEW